MSGVASALAQAANGEVTLTVAGGIIMAISVGLVLGLTVFCFWRILREPAPSGHHHAPLDIDVTQDEERRVCCPNSECKALNEPFAEYCYRCGKRLHGRGKKRS